MGFWFLFGSAVLVDKRYNISYTILIMFIIENKRKVIKLENSYAVLNGAVKPD